MLQPPVAEFVAVESAAVAAAEPAVAVVIASVDFAFFFVAFAAVESVVVEQSADL